MAEDVTADKGRKDEVGRSGIYPASGPYPEGNAEVITPGEINREHRRDTPSVQQSDDLKNAERLPRRGDEDPSENDALGG